MLLFGNYLTSCKKVFTIIITLMTRTHTDTTPRGSSVKNQLSLLLTLADNVNNRVDLDSYIDTIPEYGNCDFYLSIKSLAKLDTDLLIELYDCLGELHNDLDSLDIKSVDAGYYDLRVGSDYEGNPEAERFTIYTDKATWVNNAYDVIGAEIDARADFYSTKQSITPRLVTA